MDNMKLVEIGLFCENLNSEEIRELQNRFTEEESQKLREFVDNVSPDLISDADILNMIEAKIRHVLANIKEEF